MEKFKGDNGTYYSYDPELKAPILVIEQTDGTDSPTKTTKLDAADLLQFAEFLFNQGRYESVAKLVIKAGDVLLVRTPPNLSGDHLQRIERGVIDNILTPLRLADKVEVVTLDGALDIEVVSRED
jgi:hypothetical protein